MQDFGTKADNSPPPGGQLSAAEFNNLATENENAVLRSGQTLSGASDTQLAQSLFLHSVKSESFQDSGTANAYVATPVSGASGVLLPSSYANLGGAIISLKAAAANSGASTLNIGQTTGALLGTKAIRTQADAALPAGSIGAGQYFQVVYNPAFDSGNGAWVLLPWTSAALLSARGMTAFTVNGTFIVPANVTRIFYEAVGGGGGGGASTAANSAAGGGGSGAYAKGALSVTPGQSIAMTIGAGGAQGTTGAGLPGGTTSIGGFVSCPGGGASGGIASAGIGQQGFGAPSSSGATVNSLGAPGSPGVFGSSTAFFGGNGAPSVFGGGLPGASGYPGAGFGAYGCGGSGGANNNFGGNGTAGIVIITW